MELVHHPIRAEQTKKDPSRNRPGKHLVKGVGEIPAAALGITHAALDLPAAEGDQVEATALPSLQRQQEVLGAFTPFLFALRRTKKSYDIPPERRVTALSEPVRSSHLSNLDKTFSVFWVCHATQKKSRTGMFPWTSSLLLCLSERIVEMRGEGVGGREPWKD